MFGKVCKFGQAVKLSLSLCRIMLLLSFRVNFFFFLSLNFTVQKGIQCIYDSPLAQNARGALAWKCAAARNATSMSLKSQEVTQIAASSMRHHKKWDPGREVNRCLCRAVTALTEFGKPAYLQ